LNTNGTPSFSFGGGGGAGGGAGVVVKQGSKLRIARSRVFELDVSSIPLLPEDEATQQQRQKKKNKKGKQNNKDQPNNKKEEKEGKEEKEKKEKEQKKKRSSVASDNKYLVHVTLPKSIRVYKGEYLGVRCLPASSFENGGTLGRRSENNDSSLELAKEEVEAAIQSQELVLVEKQSDVHVGEDVVRTVVVVVVVVFVVVVVVVVVVFNVFCRLIFMQVWKRGRDMNHRNANSDGHKDDGAGKSTLLDT
jgi:cobalamin biosynthesis Mg chelatase CobN